MCGERCLRRIMCAVSNQLCNFVSSYFFSHFFIFFYFHCSLKAMSLVKCIGGDKQRTLLLLTYAKKYTFRGRNFLAPMTTTAAIFLISTCYIYTQTLIATGLWLGFHNSQNQAMLLHVGLQEYV